MKAIQISNNEEFGQVRTVVIDGEPWFVGKDVAQALGYGDGNASSKALTNAISDHVDEEDKKLMPYEFFKGYQNGDLKSISHYGATIINESGLYALIFGSRLRSARRFKHWVTSEVLPAIRKTGRYSQNTYRIQDAPLSEVTALLHEASSFLREMDKVMRDQNSHPSDIAEEFKSVCDQLGIVKLSDNFVKEPYVRGMQRPR